MAKLNLTPGQSTFKGIAFVIDPQRVLSLGNISDVSSQTRANMLAQPKPWTIYVDGQADKPIDGVNADRDTNQIILYTREADLTAGTSCFGREVNVRCGQMNYGDDWGVGNMAIPRNGYVISAHGDAQNGLDALGGYHNITIVDANGNEVPLGKRIASGTGSATIAVNKKAKKLVFLQTTAFEASHFMPFIATVEITYADGVKDRFYLRYGRDICSYDDVSFLYGTKNKWVAVSSAGKGSNDGKLIYAYEWSNLRPQVNINNVVVTLSETGRQIGYLLLGLTAIVEIPGDANGDAIIDVGDLGILAANYGRTSGVVWSQGDFNGDGKVDVGDLGILAAHYGEGTNAAMDFTTDYIKAFGASDVQDDEDDSAASSSCGALGLPLISSVGLMGLLFVKPETKYGFKNGAGRFAGVGPFERKVNKRMR
jgi:uncharacterized protein (DUF2141 family)